MNKMVRSLGRFFETVSALRPSDCLITIGIVGCVSAVAQIVILRELLVLFHGNELSAGLILATWLLWTAFGSWIASRRFFYGRVNTSVLAFFTIVLGLALPTVVLFIRAVRVMVAIPMGEILPLPVMALIATGVNAMVCPFCGILFSISWKERLRELAVDDGTRALPIYVSESLGAAIGGLLFYLVLVTYCNALGVMGLMSILLLAMSWRLLASRSRGAALIKTFWLGTFLLVLAVTVGNAPLDRMTRRWQWGSHLVAVRDTPYHNLAILKNGEQFSVLGDGVWWFSVPDPQSVEYAVYLGLLQHPAPKSVLLIGGTTSGQLAAVLVHPGIEKVTCVEPDPELIDMARSIFPQTVTAGLDDPRAEIVYTDAGNFLKRTRKTFDVILMNVGDPINAGMNRFYTLEFFRQVKHHLNLDGIFSFSVTAGEDMLGPSQRLFLKSFYDTLVAAFTHVFIFPGDHARLFATDSKRGLGTHAALFVRRIRKRGLRLRYLREDSLRDALDPFRLGYLKALLGKPDERIVNKDFMPVCYFNNLLIWMSQWHGAFGKEVRSRVRFLVLTFGGLSVSGAIVLLAWFWTGRRKLKAALLVAVTTSGCVLIAIQILLLLGFQILEGFLYVRLALIMALFMAGLAAGSAIISGSKSRRLTGDGIYPVLLLLQSALSLYPLLLVAVFEWLHGYGNHVAALDYIPTAFSILAFTAGMIGGGLFACATIAATSADDASQMIGGKLYAADIFGATFGAFTLTIIVLPLYGLFTSAALMTAVSFLGLLVLLRRR